MPIWIRRRDKSGATMKRSDLMAVTAEATLFPPGTYADKNGGLGFYMDPDKLC